MLFGAGRLPTYMADSVVLLPALKLAGLTVVFTDWTVGY